MAKILAVKTNTLFPKEIPNGFQMAKWEDVVSIINKHAEFIERDLLEDDSSYQQIVVQIALSFKNKFFIHKIPSSGSESRLHDMWPILLGGHVEEYDDSLEKAAEREFNEEIDYQGKIVSKNFLGLIKINNEKPVNQVHTGLVWIFKGDSEDFKYTGDKGITKAKFLTISELKPFRKKMTWWSQAVFDHLAHVRHAVRLY